jgi:2-C-methyl-D-erythritol 4-phosphate cytidylyltransferase/2-C-methyl-D-erythritol 2,4-cyclodiphosphate synthase
VVAGGPRRQESVAAGFQALEDLDAAGAPLPVAARDRVVAVHDGARPLVPAELVGRVLRAAADHGAAIPVLPVVETLKELHEGRVAATLDRSRLATAQTPQAARRSVLREAWRQFPPDGPVEFTDEAALLEACRIPVHAISGDPGNLKVTVPGDLARVVAALEGPPVERIGLGVDGHPFGPGEPLALGGIQIPGAPRLSGHSDGDVALHAVADALLGAAGLGDLGSLFPADERTPRGVASRELLESVVERLAAAGLRPASIDVTIVAARPRLAGHLGAMRSAMAGLLGLDPGRVSIKASTGNLGGDSGAGRSIDAHAVVRVEAVR